MRDRVFVLSEKTTMDCQMSLSAGFSKWLRQLALLSHHRQTKLGMKMTRKCAKDSIHAVAFLSTREDNKET